MRLPGLSLFALLLLAIVPSLHADPAFQLSSPDFAPGSFIPSKFTAHVPPALKIAGVPAGAKSLVLIVDDPDAPSGTFTHWLVWNIPPGSTAITTQPPAVQGTNQFGYKGYSGPKPPYGTHRYNFTLTALDAMLTLPAGATRNQLEKAMESHLMLQPTNATLMGRYSATGTQ